MSSICVNPWFLIFGFIAGPINLWQDHSLLVFVIFLTHFAKYSIVLLGEGAYTAVEVEKGPFLTSKIFVVLYY